VNREDVVISALKKSDADSSLVLRVYEIEGRPADAAVTFLGAGHAVTKLNLLEEGISQQWRTTLPLRPSEISTIKLRRPGR
jgi:alpha-mannosidase